MNQDEMVMVEIIKDVFGSNLDKNTIHILLHLLVVNDICVKFDIEKEDFLILQHSQRHAGEVLANVIQSENTRVLATFYQRFGANFYELPSELSSQIDIVKENLLNHERIVDIRFDTDA